MRYELLVIGFAVVAFAAGFWTNYQYGRKRMSGARFDLLVLAQFVFFVGGWLVLFFFSEPIKAWLNSL